MKAMILAAGMGTRLRPITDTVPKALVKVGGKPMLQIILERLKAAGISEITINVHHLGEKIERFLRKNGNFGIKINISREKKILGTGGGMKNARRFLEGKDPFILHNADVYADADFGKMIGFHLKEKPLATLAVRKRKSKSLLLFDRKMELKGIFGVPAENFLSLAFDGIHVVSPEIFGRMKENGFFSIIDVYLRLAREGGKIKGFRNDGCPWHDIGSAKKLEKLNSILKKK